MRIPLILCLSAAAAACSSKKEDKLSAPPAPAPAPAAPKLTATIAGKPATLAQAFIKALPYEGGYSIYLTSGKGSCKELLDSLYNRGKDDQYVLFTVGQRLAANGTFTSEVTDLLRMGKDAKIAPGSKVTVPSKPAAGSKLDIPVDVDAEVSDEGALALHGVITAEGCGDQPPLADLVPTPPLPSTATVTLGGKQVPLTGARRNTTTGDLELSTGPLVCGPATAVANVVLEYSRKQLLQPAVDNATFKASGPLTGVWKARGQWLGLETLQNSSMIDAKEGQAETKDLAVKSSGCHACDDDPTVTLELSGTGTIEGYSIALSGTIEALLCP